MGNCLIDNWTLELAGVLIEQGFRSIGNQRTAEYFESLEESMVSGSDRTREIVEDWSDYDDYLSAVGNLVSAILLFDDLSFVRNGYECVWQRFPGFSRKLDGVISGLRQPDTLLRHEERLARDGVQPGALFYLALADSLQCDLLLSPRRSSALQFRQSQAPTYGEYTRDLLATMDRKLSERIAQSGSELLVTRVLPNLTFPSPATLVLSKVSQRSEILTAAMDLRNSSDLKHLRRVLGECVNEIRTGIQYARLIDSVPDVIRMALQDIGRFDSDRSSMEVGFSLFFFSISGRVPGPVPPHLLFLRDLVRCRLELSGLESHVRRLFREDA